MRQHQIFMSSLSPVMFREFFESQQVLCNQLSSSLNKIPFMTSCARSYCIPYENKPELVLIFYISLCAMNNGETAWS